MLGGGSSIDATPDRSRSALPSPWLSLTLLWLAGANLRLTLLAVAPLLPAIHRALRLGETAIGLLTGLPVVLLALASILGSLLVARLGARRALAVGLLLSAVGGALRGADNSVAVLYGMTVVLGLGIAVAQPAMPSLAQEWLPGNTGLATAVYSNGMLLGELAAASLTAPLLLDLVGGWWGTALLVWSLPVAVTGLAVVVCVRRDVVRAHTAPARWWPDWRSGHVWRPGLILGCASITYWSSNTFIPEYLKAGGHSALIAPALTSLNLLQLPVSFLVAAMPGRMIGRRLPFMVSGVLAIVAVLGFVSMSDGWVLAWAGLLGFASGQVFILSMALPPLLSEAHDVHRLSAGMLTVTYVCSFLGSLCSGAIWDLTGDAAAAFSPMLAANVLMIVLARGLTFSRHVAVQE